MPRRQKIILFIGGCVVIVTIVFVAGSAIFFMNGKKINTSGAYIPLVSNKSSDSHISSNAFVSDNGGPSAGATSSGAGQLLSTGDKSTTTFFEGKPVTSLDEVARIVESNISSSSKPSSSPDGQGASFPVAATLSLPDVSDGEISIDPSGTATTHDYIVYFASHYADVSFDNARFASVLKDKNGVILFAPALVEQALTDGNFQKIHDSLLALKDFSLAKIVFLKSIKVTSAAIPLDKETIAFEKLNVTLINDALAVESDSLSKDKLSQFYGQFMAAAGEASQNLLQQSGVFSLGIHENFFTRIMQALGLEHPTFAQSMGSFGGQITVIVPCPCSAGYLVTIGPPVPASLFVSVAFLSSPLFFLNKMSTPGTWWLGLSSPAEAPCLVPSPPTGCVPAGIGSVVYMAGTSL
jgi:hypothetical protein